MTAETTFFEALLRCEIELWNRVDRAVQREHGLSLGRLQALRALRDRDGGARVQDLADDLVITVGATSKLVDRLEADGSARREPNPDDRRSSLIALTAHGHDVLRAGSGTMEAVLGDSLSPAAIDSAELEGVGSVLAALAEHLNARSVAGVST